jgi:ankyrin repeat protein
MMIFRAGADKHFVNGYEGSNSPLYAACIKGHEAIVKMLVDEGADVNAYNEKGRTPIHAASSRGHIAIVKMLVRNKADINSQDEKDRTPLIIALHKGHPKLAR